MCATIPMAHIRFMHSILPLKWSVTRDGSEIFVTLISKKQLHAENINMLCVCSIACYKALRIKECWGEKFKPNSSLSVYI
jgi:hypothetical protein